MTTEHRDPEVRPERSESPGMFVDQPENSTDSSSQPPSPQLGQYDLSQPHGIGDPMSIDDNEPNDSDGVNYHDQVPNAQTRSENADHSSGNNSSPADQGGADDAQDDTQEDEDEDENEDEEGDGESDEENNAPDGAAGASVTTSMKAPLQLLQLAPAGNGACGRCNVLGRRIQEQESRMQNTIKYKNKKIAELRQQIRSLQRQLCGQQPHTGPSTVRTGPRTRTGPRSWHRALRDLNHAPEGHGNSWRKVLKLCAREENYPLHQLHPYIRLVQADVDVESANSGSQLQASLGAPSTTSFQFKRAFPDEILLKILHEVLVFDGNLVFVFSRLDPFVQLSPTVNFPASNTCSGLPARFYINKFPSAISLTHDTISPGSLLAPLIVSRKWNYFGVSEFYGNNTFAFSSFGELDRFCNGIRKPRAQRISHVEVHWMGGQSVRWVDKEHPRNHVETRVIPLAWLSEMNLKSLCIFMDESSKKVIRRPREPKSYKDYAKEMTAGQPNARMSRSIRATRGMDWVHLLRGLQFIRIYDTTKMIATKDRNKSAVRDQSAVIDLNRTARMEKTPTRAYKALLSNLDPLFDYKAVNKWAPGREDFRLIQRMQEIFDPGASFDLRKNDLDKDCEVSDDEDDADDTEGDRDDFINSSHNDYGTGSGSHEPDKPQRLAMIPFTADGDDADDTEGDPDDSGDPSQADDDNTGSGSVDRDNPQRLALLPFPADEGSRARRGPTPAPGFGGSIFDSSEDEDEAGDYEVGNAECDTVDNQDEPGDNEPSGDAPSDDDSGDGESDGESGDDGTETVLEEKSVRCHQMDRYLQYLPNLDDLATMTPQQHKIHGTQRARSLGGISDVSHLTEQLQVVTRRFENRQDTICIEDDEEDDDDDVQILSKPPLAWFSHNRHRSRSGVTRRSSSGLFCTPNPDERSATRTTEPQAAAAGYSSSPAPGASVRARAADIRSRTHALVSIDLTAEDSDDETVAKSPCRQSGPSPSPLRRPEAEDQQGAGVVKRENGSSSKPPGPQDHSRGEENPEQDLVEIEMPATGLPQPGRLGGWNSGRFGISSRLQRFVKHAREGGSAHKDHPDEPDRKKARMLQS